MEPGGAKGVSDAEKVGLVFGEFGVVAANPCVADDGFVCAAFLGADLFEDGGGVGGGHWSWTDRTHRG